LKARAGVSRQQESFKPKPECEFISDGWTDEGIMRQPVFLRLREDKAARVILG